MILVFTAIFFAFWKSPFSQGVIDFWNSFDLLIIWRVVDYTDLFALFILPLAYLYSQNFQFKKTHYFPFKPITANFTILLSLFAFVATSSAEEHSFWIDKRYELNLIRPQFEDLLSQNERIENLTIERGGEKSNSNMKRYEGYVYFTLNQKICDTNNPIFSFFYKDLGQQILIQHFSVRVTCKSFVSENRNASLQEYEPIVKGVL
ncbi:MAG: hypothetical protein HC846_06415 [Blastocatellia bacterium]|nr:hypothetical protein [Blastocatellia bacterium]